MNHTELINLFLEDFKEALEKKQYSYEKTIAFLNSVELPIRLLLAKHSKNKTGKGLITSANRQNLQDLYTIMTRPEDECRDSLDDLCEGKIVNGEYVMVRRTPLTELKDVDVWRFEPMRNFQGLTMPFREEIQELFETTFNPDHLFKKIADGVKCLKEEIQNNEKNNIELNANPATVCTS